MIAAEVARAERERIKSRSQASRSRLVHAGRWHGGTTPYGFRAVDNPDGPGKVLDVNEVEAEFIRDAAAQVLAGVPLGRVCRKISEAGAKPRRAASFSRVTLRQVLTGEAVLGRVTHGGVLVRDEDGRPAQPFPPILSFETVSALREALKPKERKHAGRQPSRLLSGLLTCHSCGSVLLVARRSDGSVTYRCQRSSDGGRCEAQVVVAALPIEEWIEAHYLKAFGSLPLVEEVVEVVGGGALGEVEERISALSARLAKEATAETFAALQEAQKERDEAQAQPVERVRRMIATGETNGDRWRAGDVHDRRALLRDAFEVLVLGPGRRGPRGFDPERLQAIPRQVDPVVD